MLNTNYAIKNNLNFKAEPQYEKIYKELENLSLHIRQDEKIIPKTEKTQKLSNFTQKLGNFMKNMADVTLASTFITPHFLYKEITAILLALWTIPGIIAAWIVGTWMYCNNYIDNHEYPDGHEKYNIEKIDKKVTETENLYNTNPQKYYENSKSAIFDYYDAYNQIKSEKENLQRKISNLNNKKKEQ